MSPHNNKRAKSNKNKPLIATNLSENSFVKQQEQQLQQQQQHAIQIMLPNNNDDASKTSKFDLNLSESDATSCCKSKQQELAKLQHASNNNKNSNNNNGKNNIATDERDLLIRDCQDRITVNSSFEASADENYDDDDDNCLNLEDDDYDYDDYNENYYRYSQLDKLKAFGARFTQLFYKDHNKKSLANNNKNVVQYHDLNDKYRKNLRYFSKPKNILKANCKYNSNMRIGLPCNFESTTTSSSNSNINLNDNSRYYSNEDNNEFNNNLHSNQSWKWRRWRRLIFQLFLLITALSLILLLISELRNLKKNNNIYNYDDTTTTAAISGANAKRLHNKSKQQQHNKHKQGELKLIDKHNKTRWLINHSKCHIPILDAWDPAAKSEFFKSNIAPLDCGLILAQNKTLPKPITFVRDNRLYFARENIPQTIPPVGCCYRDIIRTDFDDVAVEVDTTKTCKPIVQDGMEAPGELIQVECQPGNYTNFHQFMKHDLEEEAAMEKLANKRLNRTDHYSVLILGVDTISRLNGVRRLVKTRKILQEHYNAMEFLGYNKVGENTFPNLVPLLTGLTPGQLVETDCWPAKTYQEGHDGGDHPFDNCKFLWNYFQEIGYLTYYHEDWPFASTFNYLKDGFKQAPTLHYGRPFTLARNDYGMPYDHSGCMKCHYDEPLHKLDLESFKNFIAEYEGSPMFGFHWINCPQHEDLDDGALIDEDIANFLLEIKQMTYEHNTFVLVLSDHGYRWGDFVKSRLGHYEASMPMLHIAPPRIFYDKHSDEIEAMKQHLNVLLTPFDIFKSIIHLRNLGKLSGNVTNNPENEIYLAKVQLELQVKLEEQQKKLQQAMENQRSQAQQQSINSTTTTQAPIIPHVTQLPDDPSSMGPTAATIINQLESIDGVKYKQKFSTLSIFDKHNEAELDRSCLEAGIPDNYCVCQEFETIEYPESDNIVLGASFYYVYVHLYEILRHKLARDLCEPLDLNNIEFAQLFQFTTKQHVDDSRRKKRASRQTNTNDLSSTSTTTKSIKEEDEDDHLEDSSKISSLQTTLPKREYNIRLSTKPGGALFQEVIRYYGPDEISLCGDYVNSIKEKLLETNEMTNGHSSREKHKIVLKMNELCQFRVYSDSTSRLNLYRDQSKCITFDDVELKKTCMCKNLRKRQQARENTTTSSN